MELSSPTFPAAESRDTRPGSASGPVWRPPAAPPIAGVASLSLPLRFVLLGVVSLIIGTVLLMVQPALLASYHYNQHVIAVTHLFTLGFIASVIMGALYQLVPVALETSLHSERLAKWQFLFHAVGVAGMVWMFWTWNLKQVGHFGSVLAVGVALFVYNMVRTLRRVPRWNVVATAIASSLGWLTLTVLFGLAIAAGKCTYESTQGLATAGGVRSLIGGLRSIGGYLSRFDAIAAMHAHAHLGGLGFMVLLIVGVSYRLVPMFTLSAVQSRRRARISVWLLNLGLAGLVPAILLRSMLKPLFALVVVAGLACYLIEMRAILKARQRRTLDWGMCHFATALALLGGCALLGLVLSWPGLPLNRLTGQLENLDGFLLLLGVVGLAILGMLHKIIPFLVWYARYSPEIGRRKVPTLADLASPRLQAIGYWTFLSGLLATGAAIVTGNERALPGTVGLLVVSLLVFATHTARVLGHLIEPRTGTESRFDAATTSP